MNWKSAAAFARNAQPLTRSWAWLRNSAKENGRLTLMSLGVAFLLFVVSRQPDRDIMLVGVPLEFTNIPPGLEISSDVPAAVNLRLRGPRDVVQGIAANELEVRADLSNKTAGERVIQLKASDVLRPDKVQVRRIEPGTIDLKLEPTRRKVVPIEVQLQGAPAEGFERLKMQLEPATVEIEGPESRIAAISKIYTETIQLNGRQATFELQPDLELGRDHIRLAQPTAVKLTIEIGAKKNIE
ncbi:MAG TPA: CdaR family protein [Blastocatellia bacterium]|nr:CdaR family protein [Blastocatellia bacterium]